MKILIAEDNFIGAMLLEILLQEHGYQPILVRTGKEAIECLATTPDIQLLISETAMPEMDGLELLSKMREHPDWQQIPVIMCTALSDTDTVKRAIALGCKHYVLKPINGEALMRKVESLLDDVTPVLMDMSQTIAQLGLDVSSYGKLAEAFAAQVIDAIGVVEQQIENGQPADLPISMDQLREGAATVGAKRVQNAIEKLAAINESINTDQRVTQYRMLLSELQNLLRTLPLAPEAAA